MKVGIDYIGVVNTFDTNGGPDQKPRLDVVKMFRHYERGDILDERGYKIERLDFGDFTEIVVYKTKEEMNYLLYQCKECTGEDLTEEAALLIIAESILQFRKARATA